MMWGGDQRAMPIFSSFQLDGELFKLRIRGTPETIQRKTLLAWLNDSIPVFVLK